MRQHRNKPRRKLSSVSLSADVTNQITDLSARSFFYIYIYLYLWDVSDMTPLQVGQLVALKLLGEKGNGLIFGGTGIN